MWRLTLRRPDRLTLVARFLVAMCVCAIAAGCVGPEPKGSVAVTLLGLPTGVTASFRVGTPGGDSVAVTGSGTQTVSDLTPGSYFVHADAVVAGGIQYTPSPASQTVTVVEDETTTVTIQYTPVQLPATALRVLTEPSATAGSGVVFAQQPAIELRNAVNGTVAQAGVVVTVAIGTGGGTLGGTTTATTTAAGVATFTNLSISGTTGARTLLFSAPGLSNATSGAVVLTAGAASQVIITTQPSTSTVSGAVLAQQPVLQLRDAAGNAVAQAGVNVTAAIATGGGALGGTLTVATTATGTATFTNLSITGAAGDRTLVFSAPALTGATSGTVTVTVAVASKLGMVTQPSATAGNGIPFAQQPAVQLQDAGSNPIAQAGVLVTAAIATGGGILGGTTTATTNAAGIATFTNLSISGTTGARTLVFSAPGVTSVTSGTVTLGAGAPAQLILVTQPSATAVSGAVFAQQPSLQLADAVGNLVSQAGVNVTVVIGTGAAALSGTLTVPTNASGVATFTNLAITGAAGNRTLSFTAPGLTSATSTTIAITAPPGGATQLSITTQPSATAASGAVFAQQPVVQLRDGANNPIAQAGVIVTASIASGGGTLGGTVTATTNAAGVATFTNLSISGTAGTRTILFSAPGLTGVTSGNVVISAGASSQLSITTQPSATAVSGAVFAQQPVLQLLDASGNAVSQAGVNVTAAIASGAGTLGGTLTVATNGAGVATFTDLAITGSAGNRTLSFAATGLTGATSTTIAITAPAGATKLSITTQPSATAASGAAFAQQPVIQLRDAADNPVAQAGVIVTASIASGGGTLGGTVTATTNAAGTATFTNLSITGVIGNRTLLFSATGLTGVTSGTVNITAGAAAQLSITTQPSATAVSGAVFAQQPVLQLLDASGNAVSQTGVNVTAAIASGGGTLGGTLTVATSGAGVATFTNLAITGGAGPRTLSFAAAGLTGATSTTITISAPVVATKLSITTQPSATAASGAAFAQQPVIQLRDAGDNPVAQAGEIVTASIASGGGTLGGTVTATTNAAGTATFTNLSISGVIGNRTLLFSATGLTGVTSGTVDITAGAAAQLSMTQQPPNIGRPSQTISPAPAVQLLDASGNVVSQAGFNVTAAVASGAGTIGGTFTVATSAGGTATFTNLVINGSAGVHTLGFSASGLTGATSTAIDLQWVMTINASNAGGASGMLSFTYPGGGTFTCTINSVGAKTGCGFGIFIPSTVANITLTATRDAGWMNLTWTGACAGIGTDLVANVGGNVAQCTLAMTSDRSVSVTFSP